MDLYQNKKFIPMLLSEEKAPFDDPDYLFELKFDGTRTLIYINQEEILIKNRRGVILNKTYPELLDIQKQIKKKVIFDGEIILMEEGVPSFEKLQQRALLKDSLKIKQYSKRNPVIFIAYDLLYENDDITQIPLIKRKKRLDKYVDSQNFVKSKYIENKGILLFEETQKLGLEGIVAKHKQSTYQINKRSKDWFKIKNMIIETFFIGGYQIHPKGLSLLLIEKVKKNYSYVGKVNISKSNLDYQKILKIPVEKNPIILKSNFIHLKLKLTCKVEYMNRTKGGFLRAPIYKELV